MPNVTAHLTRDRDNILFGHVRASRYHVIFISHRLSSAHVSRRIFYYLILNQNILSFEFTISSVHGLTRIFRSLTLTENYIKFIFQISVVWMDLEPDPYGCKFDSLQGRVRNSSVDNYKTKMTHLREKSTIVWR